MWSISEIPDSAQGLLKNPRSVYLMESEITGKITGAAVDAHRKLGPAGFDL